MEKILLLTKSNFKKNKGNSIGIFALLLISAALIGLVLLMFFDAYPTARKEADRLNCGDGYIALGTDLAGLDDEFVRELIKDDVKQYEIHHCLRYDTASVPFGKGFVAVTATLDDSAVFEKKMDRVEIIEADDSIKSDYVYLPYQFYASGGFNIGDNFSVELLGTKYEFKVKGFVNTTYMGCNNNSIFQFILDDTSYAEIREKDCAQVEAVYICYELKDDVKQGKFSIKIHEKVLGKNTNSLVSIIALDDAIIGKSFMALILAVAFLVMNIILMLVIILMLSNCIGNYIKENMQIIGALKAMGYSSKNIRTSLIFLFELLAVFASILGIGLSYALMPLMAKIVVGQMGLPYSVSFNALAVFVPLVFEILFVFLISLAATAGIKKIEPIVALRDGINGHNFKKNYLPLDKSVLGLNISLAIKTFFNNRKQNIIIFFITGLLVFSCVLGLLMYENFSRKPNMKLLTFETCGGVIGVNYNRKDEAREFLESIEEISNIRDMINLGLTYKGEERLIAYTIDDIEKLSNKEVCYKGRLPKYDNETAISGKFAKLYDLKIGDEIELNYGGTVYSYLITGYIQTTNNFGKEAILTHDAIAHLISVEYFPGYFWFDCDNKEISQKVLDEVSEKFGADTLSTLNFYEVMEGSLTTFKGISLLMMVLIFCISVIVISMILFLFVKALIYNKRKDYGIYKALGYTSANLMLQTALSFMPAIILGVVCFSFVSYFLANPYMSVVMFSFGLMKCNFTIPVGGVVLLGAALILIAFVMALLQSAKVRKIEPYRMIVGE